MKKYTIEDAVGFPLAHDLTRIIPGVEKGPLFKRGHVIQKEDLPLLLDIGKKHVFVMEENDTGIHEDEAAQRIVAAVGGAGFQTTPPAEGKVNLLAEYPGVLRIREERLDGLLEDPEISFATAFPDLPYKKDEILASCRIIPLMKEKSEIEQLEQEYLGQSPLIELQPYLSQQIGIVVTGSEISEGRVQDAFGPRLMIRNQELCGRILGISYPGDEQSEIEKHIRLFLEQGATMVQLTGGMSVDPDDSTKFAISTVCDETIIYGTSVLPGAMFMLAYKGDVPVIGLPAGVVASSFSIFDLVVPRLFTGEKLSRKQFRKLALGGLLSARK